EDVTPDLFVLGKALTGGYLPLALTVVAEKVFEPFLRRSGPEATLFYGHSYTGNALGCAAALASLEIFGRENVLAALQPKIALLSEELARLEALRQVKEVRQCGFICAIELREGDAREVCIAARKGGLLTRPIRNSIIFMPPFCITEAELRQAIGALAAAIEEVCNPRTGANRELETCGAS
ncbi:MAG TPA: aminotransferase class III-fold pyridoxal phosphate-dependent enzyme, partial [Chthoniobacterales bacterium]|nr:aminotransferase class III-fold pyridoxal phosphate-dependent enzyme [Chthoniobacterales bacterium]